MCKTIVPSAPMSKIAQLWPAIVILPMLVGLAARAEAQDMSYSKGENVVVCSHALATPSMKAAIEQKADPAYIQQLEEEAHCVPLPPDVGFRVVKPVEVTTPTGTVNEVVGEVTLPDGSRSQFYILKDDIDTAH